MQAAPAARVWCDALPLRRAGAARDAAALAHAARQPWCRLLLLPAGGRCACGRRGGGERGRRA
eukprot:3926017-Prymnesium_polylepis.1